MKQQMEEVFIRDYQKSDERQWVYTKALSYLFSDFFDDCSQKKDQFESELYRDKIELVAEQNGVIVGLIDIAIYQEEIGKAYMYYPSESIAYFSNFAVHPDYQGKKIGQLLFEEAHRQLKIKGIEHLAIFSRSDKVANHLYRKWGAKLIATDYLVVGVLKDQPETQLSLDHEAQRLKVSNHQGDQVYALRSGIYLVTEKENIKLFDTEKIIEEYSYILRV